MAGAGTEKETKKIPQEAATGKRWFGRGIYGSKDVPIRLLDGFIALAVVTILVLTFLFAQGGGYDITFDSCGGSEVEAQKLRHGTQVAVPDTPTKPGYTFDGWYTSPEEDGTAWEFESNVVENTMTLYAHWVPAQIAVKFDLDGGTVDGKASVEDKTVTYGETYGPLPTPEKEGFRFDGWIYSGEVITEDTVVTMTGEHVLTARWAQRAASTE